MQREDVINYIKKNDIQFIRLQFTDILGTAKNVSIPVEQLNKALNNELMFDGSSIKGFVRIEESDMILAPDPATLRILPWKTKGGEARMLCDILNYDGSPFMGCPRNNLKRIISEAAQLGFEMNVGPEMEFFLFPLNENGEPQINSPDKASYFDLSPIDRGEDARRDMVITLQKMGFNIEASHHEVAPGQHEIGFKYADPLTMADMVVTFKDVIRNIAQRHNMLASFMPKPIFNEAGSGMHINLSLFSKGANAFYDSHHPQKLSPFAFHFLAGLIEHAPALCAITNPVINSYKRLVPDYEAPVYIAWSTSNRSPLIRIPAARGIGTRLELRSPDPACNPYTAFAVVLGAGLDGIKKHLSPPTAVNRNIYEMTSKEHQEFGIKELPSNLLQSLEALKCDETIKNALGEHILINYLAAKELEWKEYNLQVHPWELKKYLI